MVVPLHLSLSQAGRKEGMKLGSQTNSALAWEVIRLLGVSHRPEWLVMENVPAISNKNNIRDFNQIIEKLNRLGYRSRFKIFDATDFDVPQTRQRCLMVSRYHGTVPDFPKPLGLHHVLGDYLEPNPDPKFYLSPSRVKKIILESERERERGNGFRFSPSSKDGVAHSITTNPDRKCSTFVIEGARE